ncbi:MAG: glycosyltransferase family 4 protein [Myxococcota bacterium]
MIRVLWLVRSNLRSRPGGDTTQILRTKEALHELGAQVTLSSEAQPRLLDYDLVHLFHLDRVWQNLLWVKQIRASGVPAVMSPIYWPTFEFDRLGRRGLQGSLSRKLGSMRYAGLRALQHSVISSWVGHDLSILQPGVLHFEDSVRSILDSVHALLPNSRAEQLEIERHFGALAPSHLIPNAVDVSIFRPPRDEARRSAQQVIYVGRIEPRKNQLGLIRALSGTPIQLAVIGQPARFGHRYARQCRRAAGPNVTFHGWQAPSALARYYREAQVHACTSWYETPGLASLEAAASGCQLVATDRGATREYFGDQIEYCSPNDPASIRSAVEKAMIRESNMLLRDHIAKELTWRKAGERTLAVYHETLK